MSRIISKLWYSCGTKSCFSCDHNWWFRNWIECSIIDRAPPLLISKYSLNFVTTLFIEPILVDRMKQVDQYTAMEQTTQIRIHKAETFSCKSTNHKIASSLDKLSRQNNAQSRQNAEAERPPVSRLPRLRASVLVLCQDRITCNLVEVSRLSLGPNWLPTLSSIYGIYNVELAPFHQIYKIMHVSFKLSRLEFW